MGGLKQEVILPTPLGIMELSQAHHYGIIRRKKPHEISVVVQICVPKDIWPEFEHFGDRIHHAVAQAFGRDLYTAHLTDKRVREVKFHFAGFDVDPFDEAVRHNDPQKEQEK